MIRAAAIRSEPWTPLLAGAWRIRTVPIASGLWRELIKAFLDPYRPELHYMRGPGPKWREKHGYAGRDSAGPASRRPEGACS